MYIHYITFPLARQSAGAFGIKNPPALRRRKARQA